MLICVFNAYFMINLRYMNIQSKLYKIRYRETHMDRKNLAWRIVCKKIYQKYISSEDTVLDIASGHGEFINNINAGKKIAIDLNPDSEIYLNKDVEFHNINAFNLSVFYRCSQTSLNNSLIESY